MNTTKLNLKGAYLRSANLAGADLRGADLRDAVLMWADLRGANLQGADLRGANLRGADTWGANLTGITAFDQDLSILPQMLWEHSQTKWYRQNTWGGDWGSICCLAGRAAEFVGRPGSIIAGVLAIAQAMPGFRLEVLYQPDPAVALAELKRFL